MIAERLHRGSPDVYRDPPLYPREHHAGCHRWPIFRSQFLIDPNERHIVRILVSKDIGLGISQPVS